MAEPTKTLSSEPLPTPEGEITPTNNDHPPRLSLWRLFLGLFVVLIGFQLLGINYGWNWLTTIDFWRLWPVPIILIGISMLGQGRVINRTVGMILTLAVIALVTLLVIRPPATKNPIVKAEIARTISVPLGENITSTKLSLDMSAASINIQGGSSEAVSGIFTSTFADLTTSNRLEGAIQDIKLDTAKINDQAWWWSWRMKNILELRLNGSRPVDLDIHSGAASIDLDLRTLTVPTLLIEAGASSINLKLGDKAVLSQVSFDSGATSINIDIPRTVDGLQIRLDAGLSSKTLPSNLKNLGEGLYQSEGYSAATKRVEIAIDAGASSIDIHWE